MRKNRLIRIAPVINSRKVSFNITHDVFRHSGGLCRSAPDVTCIHLKIFDFVRIKKKKSRTYPFLPLLRLTLLTCELHVIIYRSTWIDSSNTFFLMNISQQRPLTKWCHYYHVTDQSKSGSCFINMQYSQIVGLSLV